jgi:hypothetical protein
MTSSQMRARTSWASLSADGPLLLRSAMTGCYAISGFTPEIAVASDRVLLEPG